MIVWTRGAETLGGGINGHIFKDIISSRNLFAAWREFRRGKRLKDDVQRFEFSLEDNIFELQRSLQSKTYRHGSYQSFYVRDPKLRHIHKATIRDRLLHQAVFRGLYHLFDKRFIHDSYSCRLGKGTHKGVLRLQELARSVSANNRQTAYALKCDIKKFFASIDRGILLNLLEKKIPDADTRWLVWQIVESFRPGLPLGNVTSQLFANIYLNDLDQFVKHKLRERYYIRYCDDFIILGRGEKHLLDILPHIQEFLTNELRLALHPDKIILCKLSAGIDFLGYVVLPYHTVLRTRTKRRMMKKIFAKHNTFLDGAINDKDFLASISSYEGMLKHCRGHELRQRLYTIAKLVIG